MQASNASTEKPLPRALQRQGEAIKARFGDRHRGPKDPAAPEVPPVDAGTLEAATTADPNPTPTPPQAPPADPRDSDPAYWKQRFLAMEGRHKIQRGEHEAVIDGLTQRITELSEQIRTLEANAPQAPVDLGEFLTPEQVALLGEDESRTIVNAVLVGARKEVAKLVDAEIKPLRDAQTTTTKRSHEDAKREFLAKLEELVPNFAEIDVSPGWEAWLAEEDSTGLVRQEAVNAHIAKANAVGLAKMFKAYEASIPEPPAPPVAPNGSASSGAPAPQQPAAAGFRPTPKEIQDFYKRKSTIRKGAAGYVTDQEALAFEKRLKLPPRR